jgi:hypothetical protein
MKLSRSECCTLSVVDILVDGLGMSAKLFSFKFATIQEAKVPLCYSQCNPKLHGSVG